LTEAEGSGATGRRALRWTASVLAVGALLALALFLLNADEEPALLFYCGAGLRPAAAEIVQAFTDATGIDVECDYAGSGVLISRIRVRRGGDLCMPGDVWYLDRLKEDDLLASEKTVVFFEPVILVAEGNPKDVASLADLTRPGLRLGLGNPEACQIGRITRTLLRKNDVDPDAIERNLTFSSMTVNELGLQLKAGRIDAAIVWDAIAAYYAGAAETVRIPPEQNEISRVAIGVLSCSDRQAAAGRFVEFTTSERAKEIFAAHHYRTEPPPKGVSPK